MLCAAAVLLGAAGGLTLRKEIQNLPGAPPVGFKMHSGYVDVGGNKSIFYWHVESEKAPATDPIMIWTNGGPGCSGLGGFMTEQGSFRPTKDGNLTLNPHRWNKIANMVFIEQPAGVGFSPAPAGLSYGDEQAATDNHAFIVGFLEVFPEYKTRDLYITSESYGGHYLPTLAVKLVEKKDVKNFKGIFLGNPLTYMPHRNYGQFGTYYGHQLLPLPLWQQYLDAGCKDDDSSDKCQELEDEFQTLTANMDPYALDFPVCNDPAQAAGRHERHTLLRRIRQGGAKLGGYFPEDYEPCDSDWSAAYLNRKEVQEAIHALPTKWSDCANIDYSQDDVDASVVPLWQRLVKQNLRSVIYSGDDDSICASMGTQQWLWNSNLTVVSKWAPWTVDGQTAGFITKFEGLSFVTVHGAGHMVPSTRPAQSLELLSRFLKGELTA